MNQPARIGEHREEPLRITIERPRSDVAVMRLSGDLDLLTAPLLQRQLRPLLGGEGTVLVDLTGIGFLGSAGLAELTAARDTAATNGSRIVLVASGRAVVRPLEVTGLYPIFEIRESVEAALEAL
jgi:anti-sigma B factor antagonist